MGLPIAVLGAGNSGLAMAGHLSASGCSVRLWNRGDEDSLRPIEQNGGIELSGVVAGTHRPDVLTHDLGEAVRGVKLILVTVPASGHRGVVSALAPHLVDGQMIVLNPGRTGGTLEASRLLRLCKCDADVIVAETQTIAYTCRKTSPLSCSILSLKRQVELAAPTASDTEAVLAALPDCLRNFFCPSSLLRTSLGNVGMILHCVPMLFSIGWIETERTHFKYYYEAITPSVAGFLEKIDEERLAVARELGEELPDVAEWMRRSYGVSGNDLFECIQNNRAYAEIDAPETLRHRYLFEDVPNGLVPLEAIGLRLQMPMHRTGLVVSLAEQITECRFRQTGRCLSTLGLHDSYARRDIGNILRGVLNNCDS